MKMEQPVEHKPFWINFKNKDRTIYSVRCGVLCIFFSNDFGWLNVPDSQYNRTWSYINSRGFTYIPENKLQELSQKFVNGKELLK